MPAYTFETTHVVDRCSRCPMLSYDSEACGLGMGGPTHRQATHMLDHPEWLFKHRPPWCQLKDAE